MTGGLPSRVMLGLLLPVTLLALWQVQAARGGAHAYAFVPLGDIAGSFAQLASSGELAADALASLRRAITGLAVGGVAGIALGALLGSSAFARRAIGPLLNTFRQVPLLGWLPLIALWLGNGDASKLLLVALAAFYPTALNAEEGIRAAEKQFVEVGRLYGFTRWQIFEHVAWPAALPFIFTGIGQALAFTWIATIGTELMFGSGAGLGSQMQQAQAGGRLDIVLVCIACVGLMGFLMNQGFAVVRNHALRWRPVRNV